MSAAALVVSASLVAATACHTACRRGASGDRPADQGVSASPSPQPPPSPARRSRPSPPLPLTCWDRAKTAEERDACAEAEYETADAELNSVYKRVLAEAEPGLASAIRSAEKAWLRYRDAYLASLSAVASRAKSRATVDGCQSIVQAWITRGRVAELKRLLPAENRDSSADEASCDGTPMECRQAASWLEAAYRRVAASSPPGLRRLNSSQDAWLGYLKAETAAVLAWQRPSELSLRERLQDSVRVRLSLDRIAHLATFEAYREGVEERCERLRAEAKILADLEAKCSGGEAKSCTSLGHALQAGWYSIDHDRPRARALYQKACDLGDGNACGALAYLLTVGQGVARDLVQAARVLQRGCDAGDAANCEGVARAHARGDGVPRDAVKALALWQHSCELSRSDTRSDWSTGPPCPSLARALETGDPLPRDTARALAMYEEWCGTKEYGSCAAAARLLRKEGPSDASRVASLYRKACEDGQDAPTCVELGDFLRDGNDTPGTRQLALRWYESACSHRFVPGCRAASRLTGAPMGDPDDPVPDPDYIRTVRFVVADQVPALRLRLFGGDDGTVVRMRVYDEGEHRVTQEITVPDTSASPYEGRLPAPVDLNFDGYNDLTLRHYSGANNYGDFIWIFDPRRRRFEYCPELSDQPNLQLDPEHRVVTSYYHLSGSEGAASRYEWIRGRAVLVRQDTTQYILTETVSCIEQVTRERIRGRLVETKRSCEPIERSR